MRDPFPDGGGGGSKEPDSKEPDSSELIDADQNPTLTEDPPATAEPTAEQRPIDQHRHLAARTAGTIGLIAASGGLAAIGFFIQWLATRRRGLPGSFGLNKPTNTRLKTWCKDCLRLETITGKVLYLPIHHSQTTTGKAFRLALDRSWIITFPLFHPKQGFMGFRSHQITTITIPNSVTRIGSDAFAWCSELHSITIPDSVTSIGANAFAGCSTLQLIIIPASITRISDRAFWGCSALQSIAIPASITRIGNRTFWGCSALQYIAISENVKTIGEEAFAHCSALQYTIIPSGVISIGQDAFQACDNLKFILAPDTLKIDRERLGIPGNTKILRYDPALKNTSLHNRCLYVKALYTQLINTHSITDASERQLLQTDLLSTFFDKKKDLDQLLQILPLLEASGSRTNKIRKKLPAAFMLIRQTIEAKYNTLLFGGPEPDLRNMILAKQIIDSLAGYGALQNNDTMLKANEFLSGTLFSQLIKPKDTPTLFASLVTMRPDPLDDPTPETPFLHGDEDEPGMGGGGGGGAGYG